MNRAVLFSCLLALVCVNKAQTAAFELKLDSAALGIRQTDCEAGARDAGMEYSDGYADGGPLVGGCADGGCTDGGCGMCNACCSNRGTFFGEFESTFFRYHRANGVLIGMPGATAETQVEFDFEHAPRITLGYISAGGLGVRARWWHYDHRESAMDANLGAIGVDTYNIN